MTKSESAGCTVGIALGLVTLVLSIAGVLFIPRLISGEADPDAIARDVFIDGRVPFGLASADATDFLGSEGAVVARFIFPESTDPESELPSDQLARSD